MSSRRAFVAGCAALAAVPTAASAADGALGRLDHASWAVGDGAATIAVFRKLGFSLTRKPKVQADGALSTFAVFPDHTFLEVVETHLAAEKRWLASGANPEEAGGLVESCSATASALARRGIRRSVGKGAGFCYAAFPADDGLLGNVFMYARPRSPTHPSRWKHPPYVPHRNGALGLREVWLAVPDLEHAVARFTHAGFPPIRRSIVVEPLDARGTVLAWGSHRIVLLQATGPIGPLGGPVAGLGAHTVGVRLAANMTLARRALRPFASGWDHALLVGPGQAKGAWIAFGTEDSWTGERARQ
ncbi:MAG: VOC family protein, partial [Candidatus Eremiobacteraeota bacterium]|nr:VOC family protein [Candidatus Eremiobacteraeota bacterium]